MDFNSSGTIKSPFSPRVRKSLSGRRPLGLSSAKKGASKYMNSSAGQTGEVVYKTPSMTVETYGLPLPVMVTELLTFSSGEVTVRLSSCGWCWAVCGRRVVAWACSAPLSPHSSPAPPTNSARELTLPQTDLAHKADLVTLFYEDGAQMPSCIGVSPEGTIRYWASIGQEGVYCDVSAELAGQECDRLGERTRLGLVLATTTCTVVLVKPAVVDGRATVVCSTLRPPSGWLGGIGRRVSHLFFGAMQQPVDTKLVGCVVLSDSEECGGGACAGYVCVVTVAGPLLQLWRGAAVHEHSLRAQLLQRAHLAQGDVSSLELVALDVCARGSTELLLLVAAANVARSPDLRYALATICVSDPAHPQVRSVVSVRGACAAPRVLPSLSHAALVCTASHIALLPNSMSAENAEYIELSSAGDSLLTARAAGAGHALLYTRQHPLLLLTHVPTHALSVCDSPLGSPCPSDMYEGNLSLYEIDPHEISQVTTDACGKLKAAFLFHLRRDQAACRAIIQELFPATAVEDVDAPLDRTVVTIATDMLDDIPAGDPRWKQSIGGPQTNIALGSSSALQISAHLEDKQRALSLFIDFLHSTGLWERLGRISKEMDSCSGGGGTERTLTRLGRLATLLALTHALRRRTSPHAHAHLAQVVEEADWLSDSESAALRSGVLSPSDVLYRRAASAGARVVAHLCTHAPAQPVDHTTAHVELVVSLVGAALSARPGWLQDAPLPHALVHELNQLHRRALTEFVPACSDVQSRAALLETSAALADLLLALQAHPRLIIMPYFELGQLERATSLAEKYKDIDLLVDMCVSSEDYPRLQGYIDKYRAEGMAEKAFAALMDAGGRSRAALIRVWGGAGGGAAGAWLRAGAGRGELLALHSVTRGEMVGAAQAFVNSGRDSVRAKQTAASLAKLCLIASDVAQPERTELWKQIEDKLALLEQHQSLPRDIRLHHGMDAEDTRVYPPEELVQMYIESKSASLTQYDYKKALDLTHFIKDEELREELRLKVWCACILQSEWGAGAGDAEPRDQLHDKLFFQLVDLVHVMGGDLEILLPPVEELLSARELATLSAQAHFRYLLRYGYECLQTTAHE